MLSSFVLITIFKITLKKPSADSMEILWALLVKGHQGLCVFLIDHFKAFIVSPNSCGVN